MNRQVSGFSLVEALVALVILSVIFSAVWEWFGVAARSTQKIERAMAYPEVFDQFVNRLSTVSLEQQRDGSFAIGGFDVQWKATPERVSSDEIYNRQRDWEAVLFKVDATIVKDGQAVTSFSTKVASYWQNVNDIRSIFGN